VSGVRGDRAVQDPVLKWASRAVALRLRGLHVDFRGALRARRGFEAGASRDGIWSRLSILKQADERLGLALYEEAVHYKLALIGGASGTLRDRPPRGLR
jgi:hypothetical protein